MADRVRVLWPKWPPKSKVGIFNKWGVNLYWFRPAELKYEHLTSIKCLTSGIIVEMHQFTLLAILEMTEYVYHALAFLLMIGTV